MKNNTALNVLQVLFSKKILNLSLAKSLFFYKNAVEVTAGVYQNADRDKPECSYRRSVSSTGNDKLKFVTPLRFKSECQASA